MTRDTPAMTDTPLLVVIARRFEFVRETEGPNRGHFVSFFQRFAGGRDGDPWCAFALCVWLDIAYHGKAPLIRSGWCPALLQDASNRGFLVKTPAPGDLVFSVMASGFAHHVGVVTSAAPLTSIAGNTSPDGLSADGTGVFEHAIAPGGKVFVRLPS